MGDFFAGQSSRSVRSTIEALEPRRLLAVTAGSEPTNLFGLNGALYFSANDSNTGFELWKTDGTEGGTVLVKDIVPGPESSLPGEFASIGNTLYFAIRGAESLQLWKSDGTEGGTVRVKDLTELSAVTQVEHILSVGGSLYILCDNGDGLSALICSDGTEGGTVLVREFTGSSEAQGMVAVGSTIFLSAPDTTHGRELWKSDGTAVGTVLVKDINPGTGNSNPGSPSGYFGILAGVLYFPADGPDGEELWKTDGTEAGTQQVRDIDPGGDSDPRFLTVVGDTLYFSAEDDIAGRELWKSDGTSQGTERVADLWAGEADGFPLGFGSLGDSLIFQADDETGVNGLWKSDGTEAGTVKIKNFGVSAANFVTWDDALFFFSSGGEVETPSFTGTELWKTDGTEDGTVLVKDINPGGGDSVSGDDPELTVVGNQLFFVADDGTHGSEIWTSDGTEGGTNLVADISLEDRPFPFTRFSIENGLWQVFGSERGDHIEVKVVGDQLVATRNGKSESIDFSDVSFVEIAGNGGDDRVIALGLSIGTSITGDAGNDTIYGGNGNDTIRGGAGNDRILGGGGGDWIRAEVGNDFIYGETGYDTMWGGEGDDLMNGGDGKDRLSGEGGKDRIYGGRNNDQLDGGTGHDRLFGDDGDDILFGQVGNDTIDGGLGSDYVDAGRDHDLILAMDNIRDTLLAGGGRDSGTVDRRVDLIRGLEIILRN